MRNHCLYQGAYSDVINAHGSKPSVLFHWHHTKGKRDTREVPTHPQLHDYLVAYAPDLTRTSGRIRAESNGFEF